MNSLTASRVGIQETQIFAAFYSIRKTRKIAASKMPFLSSLFWLPLTYMGVPAYMGVRFVTFQKPCLHGVTLLTWGDAAYMG